MINPPLVDRWTAFRDSFIRQLQSTAPQLLRTAWQSATERTKLYTSSVIPAIAGDLGLSRADELFRVDAAMGKVASNGLTVPIVFVESENVAASIGKARGEMYKLCSLSCPLAVLVTVVEWSPAIFGSRAREQELTMEWQRIIAAYHEVWPRTGIIGVIVGEWGPDNRLRFYSFAYSMEGTICVSPTEDFGISF